MLGHFRAPAHGIRERSSFLGMEADDVLLIVGVTTTGPTRTGTPTPTDASCTLVGVVAVHEVYWLARAPRLCMLSGPLGSGSVGPARISHARRSSEGH